VSAAQVDVACITRHATTLRCLLLDSNSRWYQAGDPFDVEQFYTLRDIGTVVSVYINLEELSFDILNFDISQWPSDLAAREALGTLPTLRGEHSWIRTLVGSCDAIVVWCLLIQI
jgi:hypothetical protein